MLAPRFSGQGLAGRAGLAWPEGADLMSEPGLLDGMSAAASGLVDGEGARGWPDSWLAKMISVICGSSASVVPCLREWVREQRHRGHEAGLFFDLNDLTGGDCFSPIRGKTWPGDPGRFKACSSFTRRSARRGGLVAYLVHLRVAGSP